MLFHLVCDTDSPLSKRVTGIDIQGLFNGDDEEDVTKRSGHRLSLDMSPVRASSSSRSVQEKAGMCSFRLCVWVVTSCFFLSEYVLVCLTERYVFTCALCFYECLYLLVYVIIDIVCQGFDI